MNPPDVMLTYIVGQRSEEDAQRKLATLKDPGDYQILCLVESIWVDKFTTGENVIGFTIVKRGTV